MNRYKSSGSSAKGRNISGLEGSRDLQRRRGYRRRPSSPAFLKRSMTLLVGFLVVLVITYLTALSSFLGIDKGHKREPEQSQMLGRPESVENNKHFDRHRNGELSGDPADGNDDDDEIENGVDADVDDDDDDDDGNNELIEKINIKGVTNHIENEEEDGRLTIAVASTITGCGSDPFIDGAAVLKYSLDVHSRSAKSKFKYRTYIFYHPDAKECVLPLETLGYTLLERSTPIKVEEIGGDGGLRERIVTNGCCGEVSEEDNVVFAFKVVRLRRPSCSVFS
jgi:hypothetical protein